MKYGCLFFFLIIAFTYACTSLSNSNDVMQITVKLKDNDTTHFTNKYLYVYDYGVDRIVDSAQIKNRSASFTFKAKGIGDTRKVSLQVLDSFQGRTYYRPIGFMHPYLPNVNLQMFYIDTGYTRLETYTSKQFPMNAATFFSGSLQNTPYFKNIYLKHPDNSTVDRENIIESNVKLIRTWSYSFFLMEQLAVYKHYFTPSELALQVKYFDKAVQASSLCKQVKQYASNMEVFDKEFPSDIPMMNSDNNKVVLKSNRSKATLIVFWASWCGPCRKEIPALKALNNEFGKAGLRIVNISVDANQGNWKAALNQEKMPWEQLLLTDTEKDYFKSRYNISAIPKSYLFNANKLLVDRFLGLEDSVRMRASIAKLFW